LKDDYYEFKISDSKYRCPFCYTKDYSLTDFLRHASRMAGNSRKTIKDIVKHSVLIILWYLNVNVDKNKPLDVNIASDKPFGVGIASGKSINLNVANHKSLGMNVTKCQLSNVNVADSFIAAMVEGHYVTDEYVQVKNLIIEDLSFSKVEETDSSCQISMAVATSVSQLEDIPMAPPDPMIRKTLETGLNQSLESAESEANHTIFYSTIPTQYS